MTDDVAGAVTDAERRERRDAFKANLSAGQAAFGWILDNQGWLPDFDSLAEWCGSRTSGR